MGFSYDRLWELALKRKLKKTDLRDLAGITNTTLASLSIKTKQCRWKH